MITCPNCAHLNLGDVVQCSLCKSPLPAQQAYLLHVRTGVTIDLPLSVSIIHIGKPNDRVPPDIDISGFPHSEVVSRVHANILVQEYVYYIEDAGSANGTYVNNLPVALGSRHSLQAGDRIALGKADKVSFLFQLRP
ncbi:MAG: FHA domain-containing protein [Elainellaceae cyanobacterium]